MSFMAIGAKLIKLNTPWNVFKVALWRSLVMSAGSYAHARLHLKTEPFQEVLSQPDLIMTMFWRSVLGSLAFLFELGAIYLMPISLAIVLYFTQPIFAGLFGYWFNGEKLSQLDIASSIFSLIGVIILSNPQMAFSKEAHEDFAKTYPYFFLGVLSALAGASSSAGAYVFMRRLGTRVSTPTKPMFFGICCSIICIVI